MYFSMDVINIEYDHSNIDTDFEVKMKSIQVTFIGNSSQFFID
jgi:hypothetical protein